MRNPTQFDNDDMDIERLDQPLPLPGMQLDTAEVPAVTQTKADHVVRLLVQETTAK
jgi:hypothetical protein